MKCGSEGFSPEGEHTSQINRSACRVMGTAAGSAPEPVPCACMLAPRSTSMRGGEPTWLGT